MHSYPMWRLLASRPSRCIRVMSTAPNSFYQELPEVYSGWRVKTAFRVLSQYTDCTEETYQQVLERAERLGFTGFAVSALFNASIISCFDCVDKVHDVRRWAEAARRKDPELFDEWVIAFMAIQKAFLKSVKEMNAKNPLNDENRINSAKLGFLIDVACLYVLDPVTPMNSIGITRKEAEAIAKYCSMIDSRALKKEFDNHGFSMITCVPFDT